MKKITKIFISFIILFVISTIFIPKKPLPKENICRGNLRTLSMGLEAYVECWPDIDLYNLIRSRDFICFIEREYSISSPETCPITHSNYLLKEYNGQYYWEDQFPHLDGHKNHDYLLRLNNWSSKNIPDRQPADGASGNDRQ